MAVVCSLRELQDLVKEVGEAEGVEVMVGATLTKLSDANGMARLLRKMEGTKRWSVEELPKLQPFVEIATAVQQALQVFGKLLPHPLINPEKDIIYMNISIDGPRDELFLKRQADKLHLLGLEPQGHEEAWQALRGLRPGRRRPRQVPLRPALRPGEAAEGLPLGLQPGVQDLGIGSCEHVVSFSILISVSTVKGGVRIYVSTQ